MRVAANYCSCGAYRWGVEQCVVHAACCCCFLCIVEQGIEQSNLLQRLGPARLFNPAHASCHWVLDLSHPAHEDVARKLVRGGAGAGEGL